MRVFISQPMRNRDENEIKEERGKIIKYMHEMYPAEKIEEINSYFPIDVDGKNPALKMLGMSIELLANADVAVFANHWSLARGCRIEHECCEMYNIPIIDLED